jgi:hypothetical protein
MLFHMAIAELQMRLLIGECREPDELLIEERIDQAARVFLHGVSAGTKTEVGQRPAPRP